MKLKTPTPIIRAIVVSLIVGGLGWIGLSVPQGAVEEAVDDQLEVFEQRLMFA